MGKTKHEKTFVDFDKPYEQNLIGMRGIIYFGIGLFLLIVVTFGLMWALQNELEDDAKKTKDSKSPLAMNEQVLTTMTSASSARVVSSAPPWARMPIITSVSTRFLGQPRLTNPTFVGGGGRICFVDSSSSAEIADICLGIDLL